VQSGRTHSSAAHTGLLRGPRARLTTLNQMRLRHRAVAAVLMSTAVFTALAPLAMAAPMPWETSKTPTSATHHDLPSTTAGGSGTVTVPCSGSCYE
jgi:hypothetical protein